MGFVDVVPSRATVHSRYHHADCLFPTRAITNNKVDFIGSSTKPYEYNEESMPARTALRQMIEHSSPDEVARLMLESDSLSDIAGGLWRIVYSEGHSSTLGQFFMNTTQIDVDVVSENQIICMWCRDRSGSELTKCPTCIFALYQVTFSAVVEIGTKCRSRLTMDQVSSNQSMQCRTNQIPNLQSTHSEESFDAKGEELNVKELSGEEGIGRQDRIHAIEVCRFNLDQELEADICWSDSSRTSISRQ